MKEYRNPTNTDTPYCECVGCEALFEFQLAARSANFKRLNQILELDKITKIHAAVCVVCIVGRRQRSVTIVPNEIWASFLLFRIPNTCLCWHMKQWAKNGCGFETHRKNRQEWTIRKVGCRPNGAKKTFCKSSTATHGPAGELHRSQVLQTAHALTFRINLQLFIKCIASFYPKEAKQRAGARKKTLQPESDCRWMRIKCICFWCVKTTKFLLWNVQT